MAAEDRRANALSPGVISLIAAAVAAIVVYFTNHAGPFRDPNPSDFDSLWLASRLFATGRDPYALIGPGKTIPWPWPIQYPASTFVALAPLGLIPVEIARELFGAITIGLLTFAVLKTRPHLWPILLSYPLLYAVRRGQWSPLLFAGFLWVPLSVVLPLKPSLGLACFAAKPRWRVVFVGLALLAISFVVQPRWLPEWLRGLPYGETFAPIVALPVAWLMLAALIRWWDPDARLLLFSLCVPQVFGYYESLYVFAGASTRRQAMLLAVLSGLVRLYRVYFVTIPGGIESLPWRDVSMSLGPALIVGLYWPALIMVLMRPGTWPPKRRFVSPLS